MTVAAVLLLSCSERAGAGDMFRPKEFPLFPGFVLEKEMTLGRPCEENDVPEMPKGWMEKWCQRGGTGIAICTDGKIGLQIDAQNYCHYLLSKKQ
jgi:hypothetical protein